MKSCLVTGAGGFIGSHLVERLVRDGWRVHALVRYTSTGTVGHLERLPKGARDAVEIAFGDVRDASFVADLVRNKEAIFHLAALIAIPYSYHAPRSYVEVNVLGTQNILEGALRGGSGRVVLASTSEVYGTACTTPIDETHRLHPQSPYAASKVAADQLAASYHRSFGLPVVIVRPFNTYGPRQSLRALIPTLVTQVFSRDDGVIELGHLAPRRDFCYVEDTVAGFAAAAESAEGLGETFNLAWGRSISVEELALRVCRIAGRPGMRIESRTERKRPEPSEVWHLEGSAEKARRVLGWRPEIDLDTGLARVIEHLRKTVQPGDGSAFRL
ncbi:MAG: GDP-mannose 4,6-dehydratase [Planctomycetes bacterium]|nr:GDP-mannose 4,6-dehydratase [Planctomycetota bacterium]